MKEERLKILTMLQEGKITTEEAERLLAALAGAARAERGEGPRPGRHGHGFWDFDFDLMRDFEPHFRKFGPIFDEEFRRKFQDKARSFRNSMRWGDEGARREAREAFRQAAEAVKDTFERSNLKETVEQVGKSCLEAMEQAMRSFTGSAKSGSGTTGSSTTGKAESEPKPSQDPNKSAEGKGPEGGSTTI